MGTGVSAAQLPQWRDADDRPLVIDLRRHATWPAESASIAGSLRREPEQAEHWASELPRAMNRHAMEAAR